MRGWTPGSWHVAGNHGYGDLSGHVVRSSVSGLVLAVTIADVEPLEQESGANAHLMAAAPALYEALEAAQAQLQKAADQFAFYADEHAKKRTADGDAKGATNMAWARSLAHTDHAARAALSLARNDAAGSEGGGE